MTVTVQNKSRLTIEFKPLPHELTDLRYLIQRQFDRPLPDYINGIYIDGVRNNIKFWLPRDMIEIWPLEPDRIGTVISYVECNHPNQFAAARRIRMASMP